MPVIELFPVCHASYMLGPVSAHPDQSVDRMSTTTLVAVPVTSAPTRSRARARCSVVAYALLVPSGIFLLAFTYWPVLQVALGSLTIRTFGSSVRWGLDNYVRLFADPHFALAL